MPTEVQPFVLPKSIYIGGKKLQENGKVIGVHSKGNEQDNLNFRTMKCRGHCATNKGFDAKLKGDQNPNNTNSDMRFK